MSSNLVIFGAGASYDAIPKGKKGEFNDSRRMPLANGLFADYGVQNNHLREYGVVRIANKFRQILESGSHLDLEEELDKLESQADNNQALRKEFIALHYYIKFVIQAYTKDIQYGLSRMTNYITLLDFLQDQKIRNRSMFELVTFNYDLLLDYALEQVSAGWDRDPRSFSNYYSQDGRDFNYYKVHGSIDWAWKLPDDWEWERDIQSIIDRFAWIDFSDCELVRVDLSESHGYIPALALPFRTKARFVIKEGLRKKLFEQSTNVKGMLCIGWKGTEPHFMENLVNNARNLKKVVIVCPGNECESVRTNLIGAGLTQVEFKLMGKEFCDFVTSQYMQEAIDFLNSE